MVGTDAICGRGLTIVAALAARWGVEPTGGGQSVWAVLGDGPEPRTLGQVTLR
jgi:hypothetical protein